MIEIMGKEMKINQIVEVVYVNNKNQLTIKKGRIYNYKKNSIMLDVGTDLLSLDDTVKVKIGSIKYIRRIDNELWRG